MLDLWRQTQATVFFVTHSIEEAVFLGDRIYVVSNSPGTILRELKVQPSDRPSKEMQREPRFQETVYYLRDLISQLEESQRGRAPEPRAIPEGNRAPWAWASTSRKRF